MYYSYSIKKIKERIEQIDSQISREVKFSKNDYYNKNNFH